MSELSYIFLCTFLKYCLFLLPIIHSKYLSEFYSISLYPLFFLFFFHISLFISTLKMCSTALCFISFSLSFSPSLSLSLSTFPSFISLLTKLWNCKMSGVERLKLNRNNECYKVMKEQKKVMKQPPKSQKVEVSRDWMSEKSSRNEKWVGLGHLQSKMIELSFKFLFFFSRVQKVMVTSTTWFFCQDILSIFQTCLYLCLHR